VTANTPGSAGNAISIAVTNMGGTPMTVPNGPFLYGGSDNGVIVQATQVILDELNQLGYTVDGTTTPGSWIISWA
jgi:hypothetical protein